MNTDYVRTVRPLGTTTTQQLYHARKNNVCRVCGRPIKLLVDDDYPREFDQVYGRTAECSDGRVVALNNGHEFSHLDCLMDRSQETVSAYYEVQHGVDDPCMR